MSADSRSLSPGEKPAKGSIVELCRTNWGPGAARVYEWFETDGEWSTPETTGDFYYRASPPPPPSKAFDRNAVDNEQIGKLHSDAEARGEWQLAADCLAALEGDSDAAERCIDVLESRASAR